jgi:hypothetical protein
MRRPFLTGTTVTITFGLGQLSVSASGCPRNVHVPATVEGGGVAMPTPG